MTFSRSFFVIGLLAFLTCCKPPEAPKPPEPEWPGEADIRKTLFREHKPERLKIDEVKKGQMYMSEGRQGPKGNQIFPVRVSYQRYDFHLLQNEHTWIPATVDAKFYKNSFGEWTFDY